MRALYRAALHLLPATIRDRHGDQMAAVFAELLRDAHRRRGAAGAARLALVELAALIRFAWYERLNKIPNSQFRNSQIVPVGSWELEPWELSPTGRSRMLPSFVQD